MERPILFSGAMVRAILAGQKTQTRRILKHDSLSDVTNYPFEKTKDRQLWIGCNDEGTTIFAKCPYGDEGDRLYVRETWARIYNGEGCIDDIEPCPKGPCPGCHIEYRADTDAKYPAEWDDDFGDDPDCPKWSPSIHMPRWASRINLEIEFVRAEHLQDISDEDCEREGVSPSTGGDAADWRDNESGWRRTYRQLWDHLNAKRGYSWDSNSWVWVIGFKKI
jgi:hypothetical protein